MNWTTNRKDNIVIIAACTRSAFCKLLRWQKVPLKLRNDPFPESFTSQMGKRLVDTAASSHVRDCSWRRSLCCEMHRSASCQILRNRIWERFPLVTAERKKQIRIENWQASRPNGLMGKNLIETYTVHAWYLPLTCGGERVFFLQRARAKVGGSGTSWRNKVVYLVRWAVRTYPGERVSWSVSEYSVQREFFFCSQDCVFMSRSISIYSLVFVCRI